MNKILKISLSFFLIFSMIFSLAACGSSIETIKKEQNTTAGDYEGQTVILHTNDVHGALVGYSCIPCLKAAIEEQGGTVILVDAGDFASGNLYVSLSKGESAVTLMNLVGYDLVTLGNHEFDYGLDQLQSNLAKGTFNVICSSIEKDGKTICDSEIIYKVGSLKIGFFALSTPETQTKANPNLIKGLKFFETEELYERAQEEADKLNKECDIVICLSHLGSDTESEGNSSIDVMANTTGIDFVIDAHSHTVMNSNDTEYPIQQTGTEFAYIGLIAIDNKSKEIVKTELISTEGLAQDETVLSEAEAIISAVDAEFNAKFAFTEYELVGEKAVVRTKESNLGNLITDAMVWSVTNEGSLDVDNDHIVSVVNGGSIRATIKAGDISRSDINTVLPFGNTIAVNYVTGTELLESLEASTFATPDVNGGFPQIQGMKITIDTTKAFDQGTEYPDSTYYAPASIQRVTIDEVNGKAFDPSATYAVVTSNFCAAGGDTYYAFKRAYDAGNGFDTSIPIDEAVVDYINQFGGVIPSEYADAEGRITIK